ncbi:MAG: PAS domain S-box protein [Alphaproteobacteria bacterium]|nr:PAS domain S-box protein [Alphaproteobacteria bacterium]
MPFTIDEPATDRFHARPSQRVDDDVAAARAVGGAAYRLHYLWPFVGLVPLVAFALSMIAIVERQHRDEIAVRLSSNLAELAHDAGKALELEVSRVKIVAAAAMLRQQDWPALVARLPAWRRENSHWRNIVVTRDDRVVFDLQHYPETGGPEPRETPTGSATPPVRLSSRNELVVTTTTTALDGSTLVVAAYLDTTRLDDAVALHAMPKDWIATVVDQDKRIVARSSNIAQLRGTVNTAEFGLARPSEIAAPLPVTTADGLPAIGVRRSLAIEGWSARVSAPEGAGIASFEIASDAAKFAAAVSILASVALLALASLDLRRRLRNESESARRAEVSEAHYRDGVEGMADGFAIWDSRDRLQAWNSRVLELVPEFRNAFAVGAARVDVTRRIGQVLHRAMSDQAVEAWAARQRALIDSGGEPVLLEVGLRWVEVTATATRSGGRVTRLRDVTAEVLARMQRADSERRLTELAEIASDWFWETDADHRFISFWYGPRSGYRHSTLMIGRTRVEWAQLSGMTQLDDFRALEAAMTRHEEIRGMVLAFPDGTPRWMEINARPRLDATGTFLGYRGTGRDITDLREQRRKLEDALVSKRDAEEMQLRFVSMASHEFRTPLAVIDGAAQRMLAQPEGAAAPARKRLDRIRGAVAQMTSIIDRTLSSARIEAGRIELNRERLDLRAIVDGARARQSQLSPEFTFVTDILAEPASIVGDRALLDQVFTNLLSNAVKYSGPSRRIELAVTAAGDGWSVAIRDHGVGVPAEELPKLFTRFFRARTAMGIPGTGVGLHLVAELVGLHGGRIDVTSAVGAGTTFTVWLPADADAAIRRAV